MPIWKLENEDLKITISSEPAGVNIISLFGKKQKREWVRWKEEPIFSDSSSGIFDKQYRGGCEFLFPNDIPVEIEGRHFPDHGYLWATPFITDGLKVGEDKTQLEFHGFITSMGVKVIIGFSLPKKEGGLKISVQLLSLKKEKQPYLFRFHPSFILTEQSLLSCFVEQIEFETQDGHICYVGSTTETEEFFCYIKQKEGTFILEEGRGQLKVTYPIEQFPYLTLYYFKKNGEKTVIVEPSASNAMDLAKAIKDGKASYLEGDKGEKYELEIQVL